MIKALVLLLLLLVPAARGLARDQLIWTTTDFPPVHIPSGDQAGQGILDLEARAIADRLGEFTHVTRPVSNGGAWALLKAQDGVCISGAVDLPERRKGDVDLGWLAADTALHGGRIFDRPLGAAIEQFTHGAGRKQIADEPRVLSLHIACSNGPIGRRAVARIDEILRKAGTPPPWFTAAGHWYGDELGSLASLAVRPK